MKKGFENHLRGFTLIELMIVITVIAILATIVLYGLGAAQKSARDTQRESIAKGMIAALQSYSSDNSGTYPTGNWATITGAGGALRAPQDYLPNALNDPNCGTGALVDVRGTATPCTGVTYFYETAGLNARCTGATYQIRITKETGGIAIFCGPK